MKSDLAYEIVITLTAVTSAKTGAMSAKILGSEPRMCRSRLSLLKSSSQKRPTTCVVAV